MTTKKRKSLRGVFKWVMPGSPKKFLHKYLFDIIPALDEYPLYCIDFACLKCGLNMRFDKTRLFGNKLGELFECNQLTTKKRGDTTKGVTNGNDSK